MGAKVTQHSAHPQGPTSWDKSGTTHSGPVTVNDTAHDLRAALTQLGHGDPTDLDVLGDRLKGYRQAILKPFDRLPNGLERVDALLTYFAAPESTTQAGLCYAGDFQRCLSEKRLGGDLSARADFLQQIGRRGIAWLSGSGKPQDWLSGEGGNEEIVLVANPVLVIAQAVHLSKPDPLNRLAVVSFMMNTEGRWKSGVLHEEL